MTKSLLYLSLALFILSGCASPAVPPTVTATQHPTLTATSTSTETPEPTPTLTATPDPLAGFPAELRSFIQAGGRYEADSATGEDGRVEWLKNTKGEWVKIEGTIVYHLADGSTLEYPVFNDEDLDLALKYIVNDGQIIWNDLGVFKQSRTHQQDIDIAHDQLSALKNEFGYNPLTEFGIRDGGIIMLRLESDPYQTVQVGWTMMVIPTGNSVTQLKWRSGEDDLTHYLFIMGGIPEQNKTKLGQMNIPLPENGE